MFRLLTRAHRPSRRVVNARPAYSAQLFLENLEGRLTPAAPVIVDMSVQTIAGNLIVTGHVQDESPGAVSVSLSGSANAVVHTDSSGAFIYVGASANLFPVVTAVATDSEGLVSTDATVMAISTPTDKAPYITLNVTYGAQRTVTLFGKVYDESPGNLTVTISGVVNTQTVVTDSQGNFSLTTVANSLGNVYAHVFDAAGNSSNTASVALTSAKPVIETMTVTANGQNSFTISGTVSDESPGGLLVELSGEVKAFSGLSIPVNNDGTFSWTLTITDVNDVGTITAQVTDWWGLSSDYYDYLFSR